MQKLENPQAPIINPVELSEKYITDTYEAFVRIYDPAKPIYPALGRYQDSYESRRQDAYNLAFLNKKSDRLGYFSRISIGARWADDEPTSRARAKEIYTLANTVGGYVGETIIRFIGCDFADLDPHMHRPKNLRLEVARIMPEAGINHALTALQEQERPSGFLTASLARLSIGIQILPGSKQIVGRKDRRLVAKYSPAPKFETIPNGSQKKRQENKEYMVARAGQVSLGRDRDVYRATLEEHCALLLFGDEQANALFEELVSTNTELWAQFKALAGPKGKLFSVDRAFPDLRFLNGSRGIRPSPAPAVQTTNNYESNEELLNSFAS